MANLANGNALEGRELSGVARDEESTLGVMPGSVRPVNLTVQRAQHFLGIALDAGDSLRGKPSINE
jgi:hypothetical protein